MAWTFEDDDAWAEEISEETTKAAYQNATIRIEDPTLITKSYDYDTNVWTITGSGILYSGQARVIGVRWGVESGGESQRNSTTLSGIRVQIPRGTTSGGSPYGSGLYGSGLYGAASTLLGRVRRGAKVYVDICTRNPALENLMFSITSDLQGSMSAARTFEARLDGDARI